MQTRTRNQLLSKSMQLALLFITLLYRIHRQRLPAAALIKVVRTVLLIIGIVIAVAAPLIIVFIKNKSKLLILAG